MSKQLALQEKQTNKKYQKEKRKIRGGGLSSKGIILEFSLEYHHKLWKLASPKLCDYALKIA